MIEKVGKTCKKLYKEANDRDQKRRVGLVIEGDMLAIILNEEEPRKAFMSIIDLIDFVICCRVSPK
jgi:magnesium-transporting ATPase (P-type)